MPEADILTQKKRNEEYRLEVGEREVSYWSKINGTEGRATVPFELLSRNTTTQTRNRPFFRNAAVYFSVLTVLTVAFGFLADLDLRVALLWALLAASFYAAFRLAGATYEVFPLTDGRVFRLLRNKPSSEAYQAFREHLFSRRDQYLLERYARIDIDRPARLERRRIEWLHDEGVLPDEAYVTIVETIDEHATN